MLRCQTRLLLQALQYQLCAKHISRPGTTLQNLKVWRAVTVSYSTPPETPGCYASLPHDSKGTFNHLNMEHAHPWHPCGAAVRACNVRLSQGLEACGRAFKASVPDKTTDATECRGYARAGIPSVPLRWSFRLLKTLIVIQNELNVTAPMHTVEFRWPQFFDLKVRSSNTLNPTPATAATDECVSCFSSDVLHFCAQ